MGRVATYSIHGTVLSGHQINLMPLVKKSVKLNVGHRENYFILRNVNLLACLVDTRYLYLDFV